MDRDPVQYLHGVFAGVGLAAFLGVMGATTYVPCPDNLAVGCFAVSIPFNAFTFICRVDRIPDWRHRILRYLIRFAGLFLGYAGLTFAFGHFGWRYSLLFAISALVSHGLLRSISGRLLRDYRNNQSKQPKHESDV
jgi:hypothetical protein